MIFLRVSTSLLLACTLVQCMNSKSDSSGLESQSPFRKLSFVDFISYSALHLTNDLPIHPSPTSDGYFWYQLPDIKGSSWSSYSKVVTSIKLKNDMDGILLGRKLTKTIYSIINNFEKATSFFSYQRLLPLKRGPFSDYEFGLTDEELKLQRFKRSLKSSSFYPSFFSPEIRESAFQLFESTKLGMNVIHLSMEILKFPNPLDQDRLAHQISYRLASIAFINKFTKYFWKSINTPQRRQNIDRLCSFFPSGTTDPNIIKEYITFGIRTRAVLAANGTPNPFFIQNIMRIDKAIARLQTFQRKLINDNTFLMESIHAGSNHSVLDENGNALINHFQQKMENEIDHHLTWLSLYEQALAFLDIPNKIKGSELCISGYSPAEILFQIKLNMKKEHLLFDINQESRDELLQSLDPSIIECFTNTELSNFLVIYNAEVNRMQVINEFNIPRAVDLIGALKLGDDLAKFSSLVLQQEWNDRKIIFEAAGKYLAHLTNIALFYKFFWMNAAQDKDRLIELKRFKSTPYSRETAEAEMIAGRKLLNVFKHIKNDTENDLVIKDINWKLLVYKVSSDDHERLQS